MSPRSSSASIPIKTPTAAVLDTRTGGVPARITISTDPDGYAELIALADHHPGMRAWALEGSDGYGAGLARHLSNAGELVVELDRPQRPAGGGANAFPGAEHPDHAGHRDPPSSCQHRDRGCRGVHQPERAARSARRVRFLETEATVHDKAIRAIVRVWRPDLLALTGGPIAADGGARHLLTPRPLP
jgi:hypothetical protein